MEYYIANNGDDQNPGTMAEPWRTIEKVNNSWGNPIQAGDSIFFNRGDTWNGTELDIRLGGTSSSWMVIGAYGTGDKPILSGSPDAGIELQQGNVGHIRIQDLFIKNTVAVGIRMKQFSVTDIEILNMTIEDTIGCGIILLHIDGYKIENCTMDENMAPICIWGSSTDKIRNGIIRNCEWQNSKSDGLSIHPDSNGNTVGPNHLIENCIGSYSYEQAFDIVSGENIQLINCEGYNNRQASIVVGHSSNNVTIDHFHSHDERDTGIDISGGDNVVVKNSIIENYGLDHPGTSNAWGITIHGTEPNPQNNVLLENNIISNSPNTQGTSPLLGVGDYNTTVEVKNNIFITYKALGTMIMFRGAKVPGGSNNTFEGNTWWRTSGNSEPFGCSPAGRN